MRRRHSRSAMAITLIALALLGPAVASRSTPHGAGTPLVRPVGPMGRYLRPAPAGFSDRDHGDRREHGRPLPDLRAVRRRLGGHLGGSRALAGGNLWPIDRSCPLPKSPGST